MSISNLRRCVVVAGRKTSVSLEDEFWNDLKAIAATRHTTLSQLVTDVAANRSPKNLSAALRIFVLENLRSLIAGVGREGGAFRVETGEAPAPIFGVNGSAVLEASLQGSWNPGSMHPPLKDGSSDPGAALEFGGLHLHAGPKRDAN